MTKKIRVSRVLRHGDPIISGVSEGARTPMTQPQAQVLKDAEDRADKWYKKASVLDALVRLKLIRTVLPHQGTTLNDLDAAIAKELKRQQPTPLP